MTDMKRKRKNLLKELRNEPYNSPKCSICGGRLRKLEESTMDHIIPVSKGGSNRLENLSLVHETCNSYKRNKILACQLIHKMKSRYKFNYLIKLMKRASND